MYFLTTRQIILLKSDLSIQDREHRETREILSLEEHQFLSVTLLTFVLVINQAYKGF